MAEKHPGRSENRMLLNLLGVDKHEAPLVFPLLLHNFFLGVGIAFLFTSASAVFLHTLTGEYLAIAFVAAGLLMMGVSRIYAHYEHKFNLQTYLPAVVLSLAVLLLAVRLAGYVVNHAVLAFAMLLAYRIVYLLANLEFWGLASLVFNVRQSKRLFGLIGSGDIPAKMLGYLAVTLLSESIEIENLLYVSVVAFLASFFLLRKMLGSPIAKAALDKQHPKHLHHQKSPEGFLLRIFGNRFILSLSIFAVLSAVVMGMVDFSFYGKVKHHYHDSHDLAAFLGTFMLLSMGVTFVLKLLLSGKLIDRLGVLGVLVSLPTAMLLPSLLLLLPLEFTTDEKVMLWFFSMLYLLRDVLKYSLLDPLFLALFQPLEAQTRLRGHTIVKGLVDPLGLVLVGNLLFAGEHNFEHSMYFLLAGGIAVVSLLWLWSCWQLNKASLEVLKNSLRKRFLEGQSIPFMGKTMAELLTDKLKNGTASEGIYALRMLQGNPHADQLQMLHTALELPKPELQLFALQQLEQGGSKMPLPLLQNLTTHSEHPQLQTLAAKLLLQYSEGHAQDEAWRVHENDAIRKGSIAGLVMNANPSSSQIGIDMMRNMIGSAELSEQATGLWLMGETNQAALAPNLHSFLHAPSNHVVDVAIQAAGRLADTGSIPHLMRLLHQPAHRGAVLEALSLFPLESLLAASAAHPDALPAICKVASRHRTAASREFLLDQLSTESRYLRNEALEALTKMEFHAPKSKELKALSLALLSRLDQDMLQFQQLKAQESPAIAAALEIELHALVDQIMMVLAMQYDRALVMRARQGLRFKGHDHRAGALEILDHVLPRARAMQLMPRMEQLYLNRLTPAPQAAPERQVVETARQILMQGSPQRDAWTICLVAEYYRTHTTDFDLELLNLAMREKTPCLVQYAYWLHTKFGISLKDHPMDAMKNPQDSFSPIELVLMLKASSIFAGTPENTLAEVAAITHVQRIAEDEILFRKGDPGDCLYIIVEGSIHIGDGGTEFAKLGRNDFFGELALVETEPRSADAIGLSDCLLLRIDQDDFYELIEDRSEVARSILVILAQRLRRQNEQIRSMESMLTQNPATKPTKKS